MRVYASEVPRRTLLGSSEIPLSKRPRRGAASESDSLTSSSSSRLFFPTSCLCYRRGALFLTPRSATLSFNEQRTPVQGTQGLQPVAPGYSGVRDPGGLCLYVIAVRFTVASSPFFTEGVSSAPGLAKLVGGCNLGPGRSVLRSTPGGTLSLEGPTKLTMVFTNCIPPPGLFTALYYWTL